MSVELAGGCHCGAVRYTLVLEKRPLFYACHCRTCQTWSGSAFAEQTFVPEDALRVTGDLAHYLYETPSGSTSHQRMCAHCHARVFNSNSARPGWFALRAGTLDDSDTLEMAAHIWTSRNSPGW